MDSSHTLLRTKAKPIEAAYDLIGDARVVLIGEETHGTQEFYAFRAELTRRLIVERGFSGVAIEGDLPDAARLHRYVTAGNTAVDRDELDAAFSGFREFPSWMWRNTVMRDFISWLRVENGSRPPERRAGVFGLDLYSLQASINAVLAYVRTVDPERARTLEQHYACFDSLIDDAQRYGYAAEFDVGPDCRDAVVGALQELAAATPRYAQSDGVAAAGEAFLAEANARVAADAEQYYRSMFGGDAASWNLRDRHMDEALERVRAHLKATRGDDRVVVWAHNSHVGDARATSMRWRGEHNLGQLARQRADGSVCNIGQFTYSGSVRAADRWGGAGRKMTVRPGASDSYEGLFHEVGPLFALDLRDAEVARVLAKPRLERAIGVVYRPEHERQSHYFDAELVRQFDIAVHFDETTALVPLAPAGDRDERELETFPSGL